MQLPFVIPGHYEYIHSSSDSKQIIRVLGEGVKKNYFKLGDGRELAETEILDNYFFLNTASSENQESNIVDLGDINFDNENETEIEENIEPEETKFIYTPPSQVKNLTVREIVQTQQPTIFQKSEEDIFIETILSKISKENDIEKYGEVQFKSTFEIPIKFEFKYDIEKLRQILKIFGSDKLNMNKFISKILTNDENINIKINEALLKYLMEEKAPLVKPITTPTEKEVSAINKYSKHIQNRF